MDYIIEGKGKMFGLTENATGGSGLVASTGDSMLVLLASMSVMVVEAPRSHSRGFEYLEMEHIITPKVLRENFHKYNFNAMNFRRHK
jgi:hypothetical protein